jgi:processive 1,2-diacylglycerol beta-glucosyltransferase
MVPRVVAVGYTRDMDEYMSASDLIVGKARRPHNLRSPRKRPCVCHSQPIPGQEERNSDHLLERGCAIRSNNPATLGYKIQQLINDLRVCS